MNIKDTIMKNQTKHESAQFREFFIDQIKDVYWAEKHLSAALKKMKKAATNPKLAEAFGNHIVETDGQIERLKHVFELLGKAPQAKKCEKDTYTRDAGLILAAQKSEHYEIASYGTLVHFARLMGEDKVARELEAILKEEKDTDSLLTCLTDESVYEPATV